jgi:hypothetical protein
MNKIRQKRHDRAARFNGSLGTRELATVRGGDGIIGGGLTSSIIGTNSIAGTHSIVGTNGIIGGGK